MKKEKFLDNHLYCRGVSLFFVLYPYHYGSPDKPRGKNL